MKKEHDGPWNAPLRGYIDSFKAVVSVYKLNADEPENVYHIDYGDRDDRLFLGKLTFWSLNNGRIVETMSKDDWDKS